MMKKICVSFSLIFILIWILFVENAQFGNFSYSFYKYALMLIFLSFDTKVVFIEFGYVFGIEQYMKL